MKELKDYLYYEEKDPDLKIYCGDCLEIMPLLGNVDLVVTSPPYNLGEFSRNGGKNIYDNYAGNNMDENDYRNWLKAILNIAVSKINNIGNLAINVKYRHKNNTLILPHWIIDFIDMNLRNEIIWNYIGYTDVNNSKFYPGHEHIFCFSKSNSKIQFNSESAKEGDVWRLKQAGMIDGIGGEIHPAPFPKALAYKIINAMSDKSGIVMEPFLGSGTTLVACKELNRNGIGIEISEKYCEIAKKRIMNTPKPMFKEEVKQTEEKSLF